MNEARTRNYLRLHLADGIGAITFKRLVETFGDVSAVLGAGPGSWKGVEGVGPKKATAITAVTDEQIDAELEEADKRGVRILCLEDEDYPKPLKTIYDAPPVLYVRGTLQKTDVIALGIVGARRCTHYGLEQADRFGRLLGQAGFTVISGGARGIDTAAHQGALRMGGRTIGVMGCGLSQCYPPENAALFEQIVSSGQGAIVSEIPMMHGVQSRNFPKRNRIISGLSLGVLVIEAARRSGSLITAEQASEQGREVFAVPGNVESPTSQGANQLIREGATLVQNLDDILEHLGQVGAQMSVEEKQEQTQLPPGLNDTETLLVKTLSQGALGLDEIVRLTGVASGPAASAMTMLVLKGVVAQKPGNIFAMKRSQT